MLAVPLALRDRPSGVFKAVNRRVEGGFIARDQDPASVFAARAAVAIDNARFYRQLVDAVVESRPRSRP